MRLTRVIDPRHPDGHVDFDDPINAGHYAAFNGCDEIAEVTVEEALADG